MKHMKISKVSRKAIQGTLISGGISLIITLLFMCFVYLPQLHDNANTILRTSSHETVQEITEAVNDLLDYATFVGSYQPLSDAMEDHLREFTKESEDEIVRILTELKGISKYIRSYSLELPPTELPLPSNGRQELDEEFKYGHRIYSEGNFVKEDIDYLDTNFFNGNVYHNHTLQDSGLYAVGDVVVLTLSHIYHIGGINCSLTVQYDASEMMYTVEQLTNAYFTGYTIYDEENTAVWSGGETANSLNLVLSHTRDYEISRDSKGYYIISDVEVNDWNVVGFINKASYYELFIVALLTTVFLCVLLCLITAILTAVTINKTIRPIGNLNMAMQNIVRGDFSVYSDVQTKDEIGELSDTFNLMLKHLNQSIGDRLKSEENEQKMRYSLLISQIDRHFVYNTMSIINSFARKGKNEEVIKANSALSKILYNYLCIQDMDALDTVLQEMEVVNAYWTIEKLRPTNHVSLEWSVPDELLEAKIPKNMIQPLVENSLRHGLVNRDTGEFLGTIQIDVSQDENHIYIAVSDDGIGIPEEKLRYINDYTLMDMMPDGKGGHIALANIRCRLYYMYGKDCLSVSSENGTTIVISLPKENEMIK